MQGVLLGNAVNPITHGQPSRWASALQGLLLVLPWVQPWASSPLPNVVPLLITWACVGLLMVSRSALRPVDIAQAWAIAALISSAMGVLQYFGWADGLSPWLHAPNVLGEAQANLRQRNQLATLTAMGIVAVLWWARHGLSRPHALWMLALIAIGNAATNSRTGLLHMLLVSALLIGWSRQSRHGEPSLSRRLAIWAMGIYLLALWALPQSLSMNSGADAVSALVRLGHDDGCGSRKVLWRNVMELIAQKPWGGWGWDELKYAHYSANYDGARFCDILGNAHNGPLQLAFALGIPAAAVLMLALIWVIARMRPWRSRQTQYQLAWAVLAAIGLHSLLEFPLWYGPFQMAVLLCIVLLTPAKHLGAKWTAQLLPYMGIAILATVAFIAVDYSRVRQVFIPASQRSSLWSGEALEVSKSSVVFPATARFAEFSITPVTPENAAYMLQTGLRLLHYSPEPKVIRKVIEAAQMVGDFETALHHQALLETAFPASSGHLTPPPQSSPISPHAFPTGSHR